MSNMKQPAALVRAKGTNHKTKRELDARAESEIKPHDTSALIPSYMMDDAARVDKFKFYVTELQRIGVWDVLDSEELGRYVTSEGIYEKYSTLLSDALSDGRLEDARDLQNQQEKAYRQAHSSASTLGLNITSRCKLVVPSKQDDGGCDF